MNQGRRYRSTPANAPIIHISSLQPTIPPLPTSNRLRSAVAARCGRNLAHRTWVIRYELLRSQLAGREHGFFLVKTSSGWRAFKIEGVFPRDD